MDIVICLKRDMLKTSDSTASRDAWPPACPAVLTSCRRVGRRELGGSRLAAGPSAPAARGAGHCKWAGSHGQGQEDGSTVKMEFLDHPIVRNVPFQMNGGLIDLVCYGGQVN